MSEGTELENARSHLQSLTEALQSGTLLKVRLMLNTLHPAEIAHLLESLPPARRRLVWELVDPENDGEVLASANDEVRASLIREMEPAEFLAATDGLDMDDLADILQDLPDVVTREVLQSMDKQYRHRIEAVLSYPEDSAGGLMNLDTVTVRADVTLDVVLRYLRLRGEIPDLTDSLVVVDRFDKYRGLLPLSTLLTRDPTATVSEVMEQGVEGIPADMSAGEVANLFEGTIQKVVALAVLMPIVASMGGIAGSQTLTLVIRGLALGHVEESNARWLMLRELAVGALNGVLWALVVAAIATAWFENVKIGVIIGAALIINLVVAALSGFAIPLLLRRMGIDPALAGSVVLTTVTDVVGFMAFLGLATAFLM